MLGHAIEVACGHSVFGICCDGRLGVLGAIPSQHVAYLLGNRNGARIPGRTILGKDMSRHGCLWQPADASPGSYSGADQRGAAILFLTSHDVLSVPFILSAAALANGVFPFDGDTDGLWAALMSVLTQRLKTNAPGSLPRTQCAMTGCHFFLPSVRQGRIYALSFQEGAARVSAQQHP
jgi:hypothetical protein